MKQKIIIFSYFLILFFSAVLTAQPSGGPYGPVAGNYDIPEISGKIYYAAPDGKSDQSGGSINNPTSIEKAIEQARTGDIIILRGGTYRTGNLILNQGITLQPYADEKPVFKGTFIAAEWKDLGNGLWTAEWEKLFPSKPSDWWRRDREGSKTPLHRFNNDMVFINGRFLQSAGWEGEVDENSFYIDYENRLVYIGTDPKDKLVEITAYDAGLIRTTKDVHGKRSDKKGPKLKGLTFTQYAYRALEIEGTEPEGRSNEAVHGKEVVGTLLEDCTISFCSRVAGYFRGDSLVIRRCRVSDTSTEGIYIIASNDVLLEKNIFTKNNIENITGYYPAAVKIFNQSYRVTCNDNLVIDLPNSNGIWYDVGNVNGVFINNWIEGVGRTDFDINTDQLWPSDNGFFFEISKGVICAGNVFVNCDHGVMILNASDAHLFQNTFVNSMACIGRNTRSAQGDHFGWHPSTGPDVDEREGHTFFNNLLFSDEGFTRPLMFIWQPPVLCEKLPDAQLKVLNNNVYVRQNKVSVPLILWSPAKNEDCQLEVQSPEDLNKMYSNFETNTLFYEDYKGPLFKSMELGDYRLLEEFPELKTEVNIPVEISKANPQFKTGIQKHIGAYPR